MARYFVPLDALINDYMLLAKQEDRYDKYISMSRVRSLAVAGMRELQHDVSKSFNAVVLDVDENTISVDLPNDYVDYVRIGYLNADCEFMPLGLNNNMGSINQEFLLDNTGAKLLDNDGIELTAFHVCDPQSPSTTSGASYNYLASPYRANEGGVYGWGGGRNRNGEYRVDVNNEKIFFSTKGMLDQIVLEYIADESLSSNPRVHVYVESAIKAYIYKAFVEGNINVPQNEKMRAEKIFYREKNKARARMNKVIKSEIFLQISRRSQSAPQFASRVYR